MFVFYSLFYMHIVDKTNYVYCSPSVHTSIRQYVNTSDNESYLISPFIGTMKCKHNIKIFWVFFNVLELPNFINRKLDNFSYVVLNFAAIHFSEDIV